MPAPTFFSVARRPKWIAGLVFALAVAVVFALLGQWQLDRTFTVTEPIPENETIFVLNNLASPGAPMSAAAANSLVETNIVLDQGNVFIVSNRLQQIQDQTVQGYWVIAQSRALLGDGDSTASLTVALGFADTLEAAEKAREQLMQAVLPQAFQEATGRYLQAEAPVIRPDPERNYLLGSLSLAELVNLYSDEPVKSFAGFLALDSDPGFGLSKIALPPRAAGTQVNWLTLFYALEWAVFAGFAVFLWWRLVQDQLLRERNDSSTN
jgi:surfeit locus 1 family protein